MASNSTTITHWIGRYRTLSDVEEPEDTVFCLLAPTKTRVFLAGSSRPQIVWNSNFLQLPSTKRFRRTESQRKFSFIRFSDFIHFWNKQKQHTKIQSPRSTRTNSGTRGRAQYRGNSNPADDREGFTGSRNRNNVRLSLANPNADLGDPLANRKSRFFGEKTS